jgi:hypothetical protein
MQENVAFTDSLEQPKSRGKAMEVAAFYLVACLFMGASALLSGIQWTEANGVEEYLRLVLLNKPFIIVVTVAIFLLAGIMTQIGKIHFDLSYYEISVIWLATSWVPLAVLWFASGIKPSWPEFIGIVFCHVGMGISTLARLSGQS